MIILPRIYDKIFPLNNEFYTIKDYFEYIIFRGNISNLDEPLHQSIERNIWLGHYPDISCFPKTLQYIKYEKSISLNEVADELESVSLYIPTGKILFHSGGLPKYVSLKVGEEFELINVFSATLDPYIANVHDSDDNTYWFMEVKSNNIRCLPIPEQDAGNEYEVIILGSPKVKIIGISVQSNYQNEEKTIVYVELC